MQQRKQREIRRTKKEQWQEDGLVNEPSWGRWQGRGRREMRWRTTPTGRSAPPQARRARQEKMRDRNAEKRVIREFLLEEPGLFQEVIQSTAGPAAVEAEFSLRMKEERVKNWEAYGEVTPLPELLVAPHANLARQTRKQRRNATPFSTELFQHAPQAEL
ncbi:hypothetical protein D6783_03910 [Candidatus Woesearchaeota archaeon]|nr:MAG: hypothetical protein D6783_03910 [Candidatus Woesearchaeota archaeon]